MYEAHNSGAERLLLYHDRGLPIPKPKAWMGIGISTGRCDLPLDMLVPLYWMKHACEEGVLLIADGLHAENNGCGLEKAILIGDQVERVTRTMMRFMSADNIRILRWADVTDSRYEETYKAISNPTLLSSKPDVRYSPRSSVLSALIDALPRGMQTEASKALQKHGCNPRIISQLFGYILGETAVTLRMTALGWGTKVGHESERKYESATTVVGAALSGPYADLALAYTHLIGGYNNRSEQRPYYDASEQMITTASSLVDIRRILACSGRPFDLPEQAYARMKKNPEYSDWCCNLLELVGCEVGKKSLPPHNLARQDRIAELVHKHILEPLQNELHRGCSL